jgi:hypothetical protein
MIPRSSIKCDRNNGVSDLKTSGNESVWKIESLMNMKVIGQRSKLILWFGTYFCKLCGEAESN